MVGSGACIGRLPCPASSRGWVPGCGLSRFAPQVSQWLRTGILRKQRVTQAAVLWYCLGIGEINITDAQLWPGGFGVCGMKLEAPWAEVETLSLGRPRQRASEHIAIDHALGKNPLSSLLAVCGELIARAPIGSFRT